MSLNLSSVPLLSCIVMCNCHDDECATYTVARRHTWVTTEQGNLITNMKALSLMVSSQLTAVNESIYFMVYISNVDDVASTRWSSGRLHCLTLQRPGVRAPSGAFQLNMMSKFDARLYKPNILTQTHAPTRTHTTKHTLARTNLFCKYLLS